MLASGVLNKFLTYIESIPPTPVQMGSKVARFIIKFFALAVFVATVSYVI